jgi:sec-independent protein translocase protein TatB
VLGINGSEFIVLLAVAAVVLGPERLPKYAQQLAQLVRELRRMATNAQEKVREELGPEFDDVDWRALDLRQYDPRRIVREALTDAVDLDDPLGLKGDPLGLKGDPLGLKDDPLGLKGVSPGGPVRNGRSATAHRPAERAAEPEPEPDGAGQPAFDPDAT